MTKFPRVVNPQTCFHNLPAFLIGTSLLDEMKSLRRLIRSNHAWIWVQNLSILVLNPLEN